MDELKKLEAFFNAQVHLLWVNTPTIFKFDSQAQTELNEFARGYKFSNYSINIRSDYNVETGIFRFGKEKSADMIAMGTHAWKGLAHFSIGSTAEDIVNHVDLPIWTFTMR